MSVISVSPQKDNLNSSFFESLFILPLPICFLLSLYKVTFNWYCNFSVWKTFSQTAHQKMRLKYAIESEGQRWGHRSFSRSKSTPLSIHTYPRHWSQEHLEMIKTNLLLQIKWVPTLGGFDFLYEARRINTRAVKFSKQQGEGFRVLGLTYNIAAEPFKAMGKFSFPASSF